MRKCTILDKEILQLFKFIILIGRFSKLFNSISFTFHQIYCPRYMIGYLFDINILFKMQILSWNDCFFAKCLMQYCQSIKTYFIVIFCISKISYHLRQVTFNNKNGYKDNNTS